MQADSLAAEPTDAAAPPQPLSVTVPRRESTSTRAWLTGGLLAYGLVQLLLRPASLFEWDEVLFRKAMDRYDVAVHSPHPPGYPVYVALARVVRLVVRDPLLALQLVAIGGAIAALVALWRLARRYGAPPGAAAAALVGLAVSPAFAFHANVGLSDMAGTAAGLIAVLVLLASGDRPARLPLAALAVAVTVGIRPQLLILVLPAGAIAIAAAVRARAWRWLLLAMAAGAAASAAIWLPPVLITGSHRFLAALRDAQHYVATAELHHRLPGASPTLTLQSWLLRPFGSTPMAVAFWLLVVLGARGWRKAGFGGLARIAKWSAAAYVVGAMFTMDLATSVRYILPALPLLALLAAGVFAGPPGAMRRASAGLGVAWAVAAVVWAAPVYALRLRPSPTWAALTWIRGAFDPARTLVAYDGDFAPHAEYVLGPAGFATVKLDDLPEAMRTTSTDRETLLVTAEPVFGAETIFSQDWRSGRLRQLTRERYDRCVVSRAPNRDNTRFPGAWERGKERWALGGTGLIRLEPAAGPCIARIRGADAPLKIRRPGVPHGVIEAGRELDALLIPGPGGELALAPAAGRQVTLAPVEIVGLAADALPPGLSRAYMIPVVAAVHGWHDSFWRTDLLLHNPQKRPLPVVLRFLPSGQDNTAAAALDLAIPAGTTQDLEEVLHRPEFSGLGKSGAMLAYVNTDQIGCERADCSFIAFSRTSNARSAFGSDRIGEGLPGVPVEQAIRSGQRVTFTPVSNNGKTRTNIGFASWSDSATVVRVTVLDAAGRMVGADLRQLPAFGHLQIVLPASIDAGTVQVEPVGATSGTRLFAYLAAVDEALQTPVHSLPDEISGAPEPPPSPWPLPRPIRLPVSP